MSAVDAAEEAGRWLAYAEDDLRLAKAVLSMTDVKPGQACYHAQQAGEKALKAVLILAGVPVGRTHDLVYLGGMVPAGWNSRFAPTDLADLGRWAVEARYPDATGGTEATSADAQGAVSLAENVVEAAEQDLADPT